MNQLSQVKLKELLYYDPEDGTFTWLLRPAYNSRSRAGDIAGCLNGKGYWQIKIDGICYLAHRLAWFYMKGVWPDPEIDHKDTVRSNNEWGNLRQGSRSFNQQNQRKANRDSKTGFLGVSRCGKGFKSQIVFNDKYHHLGVYSAPELAHAGYLKSKRENHAGNTL